MTYKALFLDIDGTILKPDHTYTESTKDAISQVMDQGVEVFLATGRPIHEISELAGELSIDSFIGYNGAYALYQRENIVDEPIDSAVIDKFVEIAKENNHEFVMYTNGKNYFSNLDSPTVTLFTEAFQMKHNEAYTPAINHQILGVTVMNVEPSQPSLYEFDPAFHLSQVNVEGVENSYDIIRDTVNKGEAITKLLQRINVAKEEAIAFGDGMNDKEMLRAVGEGFAMANAHPDLFQYAKHRTTSVTDSGIFNGLKELGLVK
ncbi:HAD family hydrolase [Oceanobacillus chungangensis]|uniref:Cof-type HAD-IIB family hydrolase n=1 Tax=Oceanobacillus chungangensis TaxID=1229152 RepID=A0A3D8PJC9_9BACI|nr:HAD family hydrolase [Oceanobacillus chungangensis]RDW15587.1 Cof-type HAD-IIB family hydrolase [Oceanobacillus chungangensis]